MYNYCLLLLNGEEDLCHLLRGLVTLELLVHWEYYIKHPYILQKKMYIKKSEGYLFGMALSNEATQQLNTSLKYKVLTQAKLNSLSRKFSPLLCILALSEVLSRKIRIFYPKTEKLDEYVIYNGTIIPSEAGPEVAPMCLMFTTTTSIGDMSKQFATNHFVPLIKFMKTQVSERKLIIFKLKSDKLKILVWVEDLMVFFTSTGV